MHQVTKLLEDNDNVRCLLIDFNKAFDTVDHVILVPKLLKLDLPVSVIIGYVLFLHGIVNFLLL